LSIREIGFWEIEFKILTEIILSGFVSVSISQAIFSKLMLEPVAKGVTKKYQTRSQEGNSQRTFKYNPYYSDLETDFDVEYCVDQLCSYLRRTNHISLTVVRDFRTHLEYE